MELTQGEMQKHHYQSVRNCPEYRMEGYFDVLMEQVHMNWPSFPEQTAICQVAQCPLRSQFEIMNRRLDGQQCVIAHINNEHHKRKPRVKQGDGL